MRSVSYVGENWIDFDGNLLIFRGVEHVCEQMSRPHMNVLVDRDFFEGMSFKNVNVCESDTAFPLLFTAVI